jgi:hypothetical protein
MKLRMRVWTLDVFRAGLPHLVTGGDPELTGRSLVNDETRESRRPAERAVI